MSLHTQIIHLQPLAPTKPLVGAACNGCGVCCLTEPCPLGMVLSRKRQGACDALRWSAIDNVYRCGAIAEPQEVAVRALPTALRWMAPVIGGLFGIMARRWIAAGIGCDSSLVPEPVASGTMQPSGDSTQCTPPTSTPPN